MSTERWKEGFVREVLHKSYRLCKYQFLWVLKSISWIYLWEDVKTQLQYHEKLLKCVSSTCSSFLPTTLIITIHFLPSLLSSLQAIELIDSSIPLNLLPSHNLHRWCLPIWPSVTDLVRPNRKKCPRTCIHIICISTRRNQRAKLCNTSTNKRYAQPISIANTHIDRNTHDFECFRNLTGNEIVCR